MAKILTASSDGYTVSIEVPSKIGHDDYPAFREHIREAQISLYADYGAGQISAAEAQARVNALAALQVRLYAEYCADNLTTIVWS